MKKKIETLRKISVEEVMERCPRTYELDIHGGAEDMDKFRSEVTAEKGLLLLSDLFHRTKGFATLIYQEIEGKVAIPPQWCAADYLNYRFFRIPRSAEKCLKKASEKFPNLQFRFHYVDNMPHIGKLWSYEAGKEMKK